MQLAAANGCLVLQDLYRLVLAPLFLGPGRQVCQHAERGAGRGAPQDVQSLERQALLPENACAEQNIAQKNSTEKRDCLEYLECTGIMQDILSSSKERL